MRKKVVVLTDCVDVAWQEIRGSIYSNCNDYDVCIEPVVPVDSYNIINANFLVRLIAEIYPEGTIICVIVNPLKLRTERIIGRTRDKNIIFEGTNTGAFSWLIADYGCDELYELYDPGFVPFGGKYVHAPAVGKVVGGVSISELGDRFDLNKIRYVSMEEGTILHIDNFGNIKVFHKFEYEPQNGDKFLISINNYELEAIYNKRMMEKSDGELVIYPGSSFGYTEIGLVRDHFSLKYNVKICDVVKIKKVN